MHTWYSFKNLYLLQSSGLWEKEWGEHMHHGFYDPKSSIQKTRLQAQIDMIEKTIEFSGVTDVKNAVDVGCGIGGSSRCCTSMSCRVSLHPHTAIMFSFFHYKRLMTLPSVSPSGTCLKVRQVPSLCRYLASKFGCNTKGITLSPVQAQRAGEISAPRGLADRCQFQVRPVMLHYIRFIVNYCMSCLSLSKP